MEIAFIFVSDIFLFSESTNMFKANKTHKRFSLSRYLHIVGKGWYIEAREGLRGPFLRLPEAKSYLEVIKKGNSIRKQQYL